MIYLVSFRGFFRKNYSLLLIVGFLFAITPLQAQESNDRPRKVTRQRTVNAIQPRPDRISATDIKEARERLAELRYWITNERDSFRQSLVAFQKVEGLPTTGKLSLEEMEYLRKASTPEPKETQTLEEGKIRVEIDLLRQVLFVIDHNNQIMHILTISSGNGKEFKSEGFARDAVTPPGRFNVYNKIPGWKKSPLGMLYYPNYYLSGLAVHGSTFVPAYPDSHGCIRIPMYAAKEFYRMAEVGTEILVYGQPDSKDTP